MTGQRADQRSGPALGPQVRVDREDAALRGGPRAHPDHPGGEAAGGGQRGGLVLVLDRFGHEDHVDVAGVVQLAAAALAHGHDGQADGGGAGGEFGPRHGERRFEDRGRDVGQFLAHLVHGHGAGQVPRGQVQQAAPVRRGQRRRGLLTGGDRPVQAAGTRVAGAGVAGVRSDGAQQPGPQFGLIGAGDGAAQQPGVLRVPGQVVGQARADAEHRGEPVAEVLFGAERGAQGVPAQYVPTRGVPASGGTEQPGQAGHGQVGIGRDGDRGDQRIGPQVGRSHAEVGEQQAFGPRRIRESHPRQPPCRRGPRATHSVKVTDNGRVPLRRVSHRSRTLNADPWRVYSDLQPSHGSRA